MLAGKYEAIIEIVKETTNTIKIELKLISYGNSSKKYMSDGKISKLKTFDGFELHENYNGGDDFGCNPYTNVNVEGKKQLNITGSCVVPSDNQK